jgi:hypothetical protein
MITITTGHDWAKTIEDIREGLINTIRTEQEEYGDDCGWGDKSDEEVNRIVDEFLREVTDEEIDEFNEDNYYGDRDEAIMCYLNEWTFVWRIKED